LRTERGALHRGHEDAHAGVERREEAVLLVLEVLVKGLAGNARSTHHVRYRGGRIALRGHGVSHRFEHASTLGSEHLLSCEPVWAPWQALDPAFRVQWLHIPHSGKHKRTVGRGGTNRLPG